jgi:alkylation response protein AidB-like acyl-CoA dehydrogenase
MRVGVQGIAVAERAYQKAVSYAPTSACKAGLSMARMNSAAPIIHHPDVQAACS